MGLDGVVPTVPGEVSRHRERASTDVAVLHAVLDAITVGTLSTVVDGQPWVVPMLFARDADRLLLHGSTGAGALRHVAAGAPAAFSVVAMDALVVAHTTFESSANYRSAVVRGHLQPLADAEQATALDQLAERLLPGRTSEIRGTTAKERAATLVTQLPIEPQSWTVKIRTGPPSPPDEPTDAWTGVVALHTVAGPPQPAGSTPPDRPVPPSVRRLLSEYPTVPDRQT